MLLSNKFAPTSHTGGTVNEQLKKREIQSGDILVFKGDDPQSRIIEIACESNWSHTGIVLKCSKPFIQSLIDFYKRCHTSRSEIGVGVRDDVERTSILKFRRMINSDKLMCGFLASELSLSESIRNGVVMTDEREVYMWESTENDVDRCQITGKRDMGVKLTTLSTRAGGYSDIVGVRRINLDYTNSSDTDMGIDVVDITCVRLTEECIYVGLMYSIFINMDKNYEGSYIDLVVSWLYDFKYKYSCYCCGLCGVCSICRSCWDNDYHYDGEYNEFYCAELVVYTVYQMIKLLADDDDGIVDASKSRTICSIEYLMSDLWHGSVFVGPLVVYNKLYCC